MVNTDKFGVAIAPASVASSATSVGVIDTYLGNQLGKADYAQLALLLGTAAATSAMLALNVKEGTDSNVSNASSITALTGGTNAGNFSLPVGPGTSGSKICRLNIDLRKRQRFLFLSATPGTTQVLGAVYRLSRLNQAGGTASQLSEDLFVEA